MKIETDQDYKSLEKMFEKLIDSNIEKPGSNWHSIGIPKQTNAKLDEIARQLNCKKSELVKLALNNLIDQHRKYTDE
jgi:hypothetical protein|tara:strand:- start:997 stop:1227 length:231 start_codon:yes stop_codon:yes gene_type:complete